MVLYSTDCPACNVLEKKLQDAHLEYEINYDTEEMIARGFATAPILQLENGDCLDFKQAIAWVKENSNAS